MNFGLDYDGTYTNAPQVWNTFIEAAQAEGHCIFVVTMRFRSEVTQEMYETFGAYGIPIICTGKGNDRMAKRPYCEEMGIKIHVWIDDNPEAVTMNASQIWTDPRPEGFPLDVKHD